MTFAIIAVLAAVAYYLGAHASITAWAWERAPGWLYGLLVCAACAGFWWSASAAMALHFGLGWRAFPIAPWQSILLSALLGIFTTPILAAVHLYAMLKIISVVNAIATGGNEDKSE
jgi:hypothetical protein